MKKLLLSLSALAMAFSISSASFADTLLIPAQNSCGCLKSSFSYYQLMPQRVQPRVIGFYQPITRCCPAAPVCCGAAAPVQPCCEKPACPCKAKKHKKAKACGCGCQK